MGGMKTVQIRKPTEMKQTKMWAMEECPACKKVTEKSFDWKSNFTIFLGFFQKADGRKIALFFFIFL